MTAPGRVTGRWCPVEKKMVPVPVPRRGEGRDHGRAGRVKSKDPLYLPVRGIQPELSRMLLPAGITLSMILK